MALRPLMYIAYTCVRFKGYKNLYPAGTGVRDLHCDLFRDSNTYS